MWKSTSTFSRALWGTCKTIVQWRKKASTEWLGFEDWTPFSPLLPSFPWVPEVRLKGGVINPCGGGTVDQSERCIFNDFCVRASQKMRQSTFLLMNPDSSLCWNHCAPWRTYEVGFSFLFSVSQPFSSSNEMPLMDMTHNGPLLQRSN